MGKYKEILEFYDRCPPVGSGPVLPGNLQKYVVFPRLYVLFDEANASNMPSMGLISAHAGKSKMQNAWEIISGITHCAIVVVRQKFLNFRGQVDDQFQ